MYIERGIVNKVALTFSEKAINANSEFIISVQNDIEGEKSKRVFAVDDISSFPQEINIFNITESDTEDLANSVVKLYPPGQWSYIGYEMAPSSPRNLNVSDALGVVETGRCLVKGSDSENKFFDEGSNKNNATFDES